MDINLNNIETEKSYKNYLYDIVNKGYFIRLFSGILILSLYVLNDLFIIDSLPSAFLRFFVIALFFIGLILKIIYDNLKLNFHTYHIILIAVYIMMFGKLIIHRNDEGLLYSSILGMIAVLFIISLELRYSTLVTLLIYSIPFISYLIYAYITKYNIDTIHKITINILPILVVGFIANIIHNNIRFRLFKMTLQLQYQKEKVEIKNKELEKIDASKNHLFSIISHDLKSPFNSIIGFSELLTNDYDALDNETRKTYLYQIHNNATKAFDLLIDLLNWSYLQLDGIKLKYEKTNIKSFINKELETTKHFAATKEITIYNKIAEGLNANVDHFSLSTIMRNLVNNAIKFSHQNGMIYIDAYSIGSYLNVSVKDEGVGIKSKNINTIFDLETKFTTTGTNNEKGSGLGLVICKNIININRGEISVNSIENKGSEFHFSLRIQA
jgi:signal transduction histidine kinase